MSKLIIGLGNYGKKYKNNRHNIGFLILDKIIDKYFFLYIKKKSNYYYYLKIKNKFIIFLKPNTFINNSGNIINKWIYKKKISIKDIFIICDDINLYFGNLKINKQGGHGGHNGLKNIQSILKTYYYSRLRFGIGKKFKKGEQSNYVLDNFNNYEIEKIENIIPLIKKMILNFIFYGIDHTMNLFNKKNY